MNEVHTRKISSGLSRVVHSEAQTESQQKHERTMLADVNRPLFVFQLRVRSFVTDCVDKEN